MIRHSAKCPSHKARSCEKGATVGAGHNSHDSPSRLHCSVHLIGALVASGFHHWRLRAAPKVLLACVSDQGDYANSTYTKQRKIKIALGFR